MSGHVDLTAEETEIVQKAGLKKDSRYARVQATLNAHAIPSEEVISEHVRKNGKDYRYLLKGEHPVDRLKKAA